MQQLVEAANLRRCRMQTCDEGETGRRQELLYSTTCVHSCHSCVD